MADARLTRAVRGVAGVDGGRGCLLGWRRCVVDRAVPAGTALGRRPGEGSLPLPLAVRPGGGPQAGRTRPPSATAADGPSASACSWDPGLPYLSRRTLRVSEP